MSTKEEEYFSLLNSVHKKIFSYLSMDDFLKMKLTTKQLKNIVQSYLSRNNMCLLKMPPNIKYRNVDIQNLDKNIRTRCEHNFGKTPPECEIQLQTRILRKSRIYSTIPLTALRKIGDTGIKILLSITIDPDGLSQKELWENWGSYNIIIAKTLELLPNIKSLELSFLNENIKQGDGEWFNDISKSLKNLQHLTSLNISGIIYWDPVLDCIASMSSQLTSLSVSSSTLPKAEFIRCIGSMTELTTLNISDAKLDVDPLFNCLAIIRPSSLGFFSVEIEDMNIMEFTRRLNVSIPGLVKLKLSNSYVESEQIYEGLHLLDLPNLTSLDLSNNNFNTNFGFQIVPVLIKMQSLTSLDLSHNTINVDSLLPLLDFLNKLVDLNLENNSIKSEDILHLIPTLQRMPFLNSLNLLSNELDQDTINELKRKLWRIKNFKVNLYLEELD